ncbi:MAG: IS30 family transposase [Fusobacteriaceae bacterium]|jgi:IS30 family transposase|nr:IS30 family transposase [Fusobacteriaceae bacterium]
MSKLIRGNQKHLTSYNRDKVEEYLNQAMPFKKIAIQLCKDPSTISKEVKKHRIFREVTRFNNFNRYTYSFECDKVNICGRIHACKKKCSACEKCNTRCKSFELRICKKLVRAPFVCNGCKDAKECKLSKYYYIGKDAHRKYTALLKDSRIGINMDEEQLEKLNDLTSDYLIRGRSPYELVAEHKEINCSPQTIYRYIANNILDVKNIHLRRKVTYKMRKTQKAEPRQTGCFEDRTYKDFIEYMKENPNTNVVEMDTVVGCMGSKKVFLTLFFRNSKFMLIYLLDNKTQKSVKSVFDELKTGLGIKNFLAIFPIILTDRGSEFGNPESIEKIGYLKKKTKIFFCDPLASCQKGQIEKNHEYIRYILPKGTSFDDLTKKEVLLIMNNINSTPRQSLNGHTPFDLASLLMPKGILTKVKSKKIEGADIILNSSLLKKK